MANWSALAGAAGLASALEEIQNRRVKEAQLQKELTANQGTWTPATGGMGGPLGFFDALFGYNKPGHIGFGGQRFQFQPYPTMTEQDAQRLQLTTPETTTTPAYEKPLPTGMQGPLELMPEQTTTREVPLPGFVGRQKLTPEFLKLIALEQLKERRELAKLEREQELFKNMNLGGFGVGSSLPGVTPLPPDTQAGQVPVPTPTPATTTVAPTGALVPGPVPGVDKLSPQFLAKTRRIASSLGMNHDDFLRVMYFETGGEFSPATKNRAGSGATGLIQFTPDTAKRLGTTTEALAQMTPEQQLDYVEKYLAPHKGKLGTLKDLYLAILYPKAIGTSDDTVLFTPDKNPTEYRQNAGLDTDKKGYVTVGDAVAAVQRSTGMAPTAVAQRPPQTPAPGTAAAAPADALKARYVAMFQKVTEQDALQVVVAAEDSGDPAKTLAAKRALEQVFPRGPAQIAAARPDTSMLVAGENAAPGPQTAAVPGTQAGTAPAPGAAQTPPTTTTTTTAQAQAPEGAAPPVQAPFQLSPEGRRQILANNKKIERNEEELRRLDAQQAAVNTAAARLKNPQLAARATQIGQRMSDLSRDNQSMRDASEGILQKESVEWRSRNDVLAKEWRERQQRLDERRRRPGELAEEETAKRTAEERYLDTQPIGEHPRVKAEEYFDKKTGDPIDDSMLTRQWRAQNKVGNLARLADTEQRKQLTTLKMLEPLLKQYAGLVQYAYGTDDKGTPGPLAQYARTPSATASAMMQQALQRDPVLQAKRRALEGQLQSVVRALGSRGDLNAQELEAAKGLIANMDASMGLGLSLGPMFGTGGFGVGGTVKPSFSVPDTPAVGLKLANELVDLVNARIGSLLRNKDYQGTPAITLPTGPIHKPPSLKSTPPTLVPWPFGR